MRHFLIVSLPRSRTAWLANFLTYGQSFCYHEGLLGCSNIEQFKKRLESTGTEISGNSDCGNVFFLDRIKELIPDIRIVVIKRDLEEVMSSLDAMGDQFGYRETVVAAAELIDKSQHYHSALTIDFNDIGEDACKIIWEYCTGSVFNRNRWEMLDGINMEIDTHKKLKSMRDNQDQINELTRG